MRETLEEVWIATMMNPRAMAEYAPLCPPGSKLCVVVWDSYPVKHQKPGNHRNQRASWSTKHHGNSLSIMEAVDLEGRPIFTLNLSASSSPRATDEAMMYLMLQLEANVGLIGGLTAILVGLPGYTMLHLFDNGFRYWSKN